MIDAWTALRTKRGLVIGCTFFNLIHLYFKPRFANQPNIADLHENQNPKKTLTQAAGHAQPYGAGPGGWMWPEKMLIKKIWQYSSTAIEAGHILKTCLDQTRTQPQQHYASTPKARLMRMASIYGKVPRPYLPPTMQGFLSDLSL